MIMYIYEELILAGFEFSPRARKFWDMLTFGEQDQLQEAFDDMDGEYTINDIDDWFIHDRDWICELLGYHGLDHYMAEKEIYANEQF